MGDIKRNGELNTNTPEAKHINQTTKKELPPGEIKVKGNKGIEVTIDNYKRVELNLLNSINANLVTIMRLLQSIKDKK